MAGLPLADGSRAGYRALAANVRGSSIPGCGHWVNEENPEHLLAQLLAFLPGR